jgi:membrane fusion protein (multidrug efflux system)
MTSEQSKPVAGQAETRSNAKVQGRRQRRSLFTILGVLLALSFIAFFYYLYARRFEHTDDAQIDGYISNISTRVAGTVAAVFVVENQSIKDGQLLVALDTSDLEVAVAQAQAEVAQAESQLQVEYPSIPITESCPAPPGASCL